MEGVLTVLSFWRAESEMKESVIPYYYLTFSFHKEGVVCKQL